MLLALMCMHVCNCVTQQHPSITTMNTFPYHSSKSYNNQQTDNPKSRRRNRREGFFQGIIMDAFRLHWQLLSWDSYKIVTSIFPFYAAGRMIDERLQNCFYCEKHHSNVNQLPDSCHEIARFIIGVPIFALGSFIFLSDDEDLRQTSRMMLIGYPFVLQMKQLFKKMKTDECLRPWHEDFSNKKRSLGGFPSGHMAEITYMTVLYGMRFGMKYAIPLGTIAVFIAAVFINCNRHYASQIVAGVGVGSAYALAASKVVDAKLFKNKDISVGLDVDSRGAPAFKISYRF